MGDVKYVVLGAGGHGAVVLDALFAAGFPPPGCVLDGDPARIGGQLGGTRVRGDDTLLPSLAAEGITHFVVGVGGTGDASLRRRLYLLGLAAGLEPLTVAHPSSVLSPLAICGRGLQRMPLSVVGPRAHLGANVLVNTSAVVEHDCRIGEHVHIATGARLCGAVQVAAESHIGAGAIVREGIAIGAGTIVGAGAVVVRDLPPLVVAAGVPARVLRSRTEVTAASGS